MDTIDSSPSRPEVAAGDPFIAAGSRRDLGHESPHGCLDGFVYMGWEDPETGEEELERVPCRRCHGETA